jgi:hypothetical protein
MSEAQMLQRLIDLHAELVRRWNAVGETND